MKNVQVYPSKRIIVPNDRISKVLFTLTDDEYREIVERQATLEVAEMPKHKRFGKIVTPIRISIADSEISASEPLNQFDCAVLCVCISDAYKYLGYNNGEPKRILANALPCKQVDCKINGQKSTIIELLSDRRF